MTLYELADLLASSYSYDTWWDLTKTLLAKAFLGDLTLAKDGQLI